MVRFDNFYECGLHSSSSAYLNKKKLTTLNFLTSYFSTIFGHLGSDHVMYKLVCEVCRKIVYRKAGFDPVSCVCLYVMFCC